MDIADLIFAELRRRDMSLRAFADLTGADHSTLSQIRNRKQVPSPGTIAKLAPFLGRSEDELLTLAGHRTQGFLVASRPQPLMPYAIPVYDEPVSAGTGERSIQGYLYLGPDDGVPADWFGVPVRGECMVPVLFPGDVVVVNPRGEPRNGELVVFDLEHEKALVKWYMKRKSGIWLEPANGERIRYDEETIRIVGVVKRTWRNPQRVPRKEYEAMFLRAMQGRMASEDE